MRNFLTKNAKKRQFISLFSIAAILIFVFSSFSAPEGVKAQVVALPAQMNKSFLPISIIPGEISTLEIEIFNPNMYQLTNMSWTDNLVGVQPGIYIADNPNISNTCGGTLTANPGGTNISLSGGTVEAATLLENGSCRVRVDVSSITAGNLINRIPVGALSATGDEGVSISNTSPVEETLNVVDVQAPSLVKSFAPNTVWIGQTSVLQIRINNTDPNVTLTETSLDDNLPAGLEIAATPNISLTGCGSGTLTALAGTSSLSLNDAQIAPSGTCQIEVDVVSYTDNSYTNQIPVGNIETGVGLQTRQGVTNGSPAEAILNVQAVNISKAFSPASILAGETSQLTITLQNPTSQAYTGVDISDILPGTHLSVVDGSAQTTCTSDGSVSTDPTLVSTSLPRTVSLTGGIVRAGSTVTPGTCTITVTVEAALDAGDSDHENIIYAGTMTSTQGVTNLLDAKATLHTDPLNIQIAKKFSPGQIEAGGTSTLTITLTNASSSGFTGVSFIDDLSAFSGLTFVPEGAVTTFSTGCQYPTYDPLDVNISTSNAEKKLTTTQVGVPPAGEHDGKCEIQVTIQIDAAIDATTYANTIPAGSIHSIEGVSNLQEAEDDLEIYESGLGLEGTKSFNSTVISPGQNSYVRLTFTAPEDKTLTSFSFTDTLPSGVFISNSSTYTPSNCGSGYTFTHNTNSDIIQLSGATINPGETCEVRAWVTSNTAGTYTNTLAPADISNDQGETLSSEISAELRVTTLTTSKAFYPTTVSQGGRSTLTITLTNTNTSPLINVSLADNLNTMGGTNVVIAPEPNATSTCPGAVLTAISSEQLISMSSASVPAQVGSVPGVCTISVDVLASGSATTRTNRLYVDNVSGTIQGTATVIKPTANASAQLTIRALGLDVVKGFQPSTVFGGTSSTMSIELINPNNVPLTGLALTDNMPTGMFIANPANLDVGTCGGVINAVPGDSSFSYSGGYLPANAHCVLRLSATMNVNGNLTNTIAAEAVTSFNGAKNDEPAATTLTNLPGVSVIKYFDPDTILGEPGQYSLLTIEIENRTNIPLNGMGVIDNLPGTLPAGLYIAESPAPAPTTDCGGTLDAVIGSQHIELSGGSLDSYEKCTIEVPVFSTVSGEYINTIPKGTIVTDEDATNKEKAEDTLTIHASPEMQISKDVTSSGPYAEGDPITYSITVYNRGDISLSNVTVTDPGTAVVLGSCTPANGSTLAVSESMTCSATHTVTAADISAGQFSNTAYADSDQTDPVSDAEIVPISGGPALSVDKITTSSGPYELGDTITYQISARNIGTTILNNVQVTDPGTNVTLGSCTPVNGSSLNPAESIICSATHIVTQTDVNAGEFSNTAIADSDETDPVSDIIIVPILENPKLRVYKNVVTDPPYDVGDTVSYEIIVLNVGNQTLHNVSVTDAGSGVTLGSCTPSIPTTLDLNEYITCSATFVVTQSAFDQGSFTNTATADSDESDPAEDSAEIEFERNPAIELIKSGTLHIDAVAPTDQVNAGDTITYTFTVRNTGNVTLTNVTVSDTVGGVTISGGPIPTLALGATDSTTFTGTYTLTQTDVDANTFTNTATVRGDYPGSYVTDTDDDTQTLTEEPLIGLAKRVVGSPQKVSAGTWDITYEFLVQNYGNVTLDNLQITDDLSSVFASPTTFAGVQSLTSSDFNVNSSYDGIAGTGDTNLLQNGTNSLDVAESGTLRLVVRVIPADNGPFENSATVTGDPPTSGPVTDISQDGTTPDPEPSDGDPTNNSDPTPVDFGPNLFDPPSGQKLLNASGIPILNWTMVWINDTNITAINAVAHDEIPLRTAFEDDGVSSGYPLPSGTLPAGSTNTGVVCDNQGSSSTITTYCYYEGPTSQYPRGRIIWQGTLGPDLGATNAQNAVNDIHISFNVRIENGTESVTNTATIDADLNGDGDTEDSGEQIVAQAENSWQIADDLPKTGFAPGRITELPKQDPQKTYLSTDDLVLEIPELDLSTKIVTVPMENGEWDVTWLGENAGYLTGSAYPTWSGNTVITAHNWTANNDPGPFAEIKKLNYGDQIYIQAFGLTYIYEVRENKMVGTGKTGPVFQHEEYDWVTLLTCELYNPFSGNYMFRRMVRAVLIEVR